MFAFVDVVTHVGTNDQFFFFFCIHAANTQAYFRQAPVRFLMHLRVCETTSEDLASTLAQGYHLGAKVSKTQ